MRIGWDEDFIDQIVSESAVIGIFLEMRFSNGSRYYSNLDIDYYVKGNLYSPYSLEFKDFDMNPNGGVDTMEFVVADVSRDLAYNIIQNDHLGTTCYVHMVALNSTGKQLATITPFRGLFSDYTVNDGSVEIELANEFILFSKKTIRKCRAMCQWTFKGTECTYSGAESWCDKTYDRCSTLSNTNNYGGFRWMPDAMENQVRWGGNG